MAVFVAGALADAALRHVVLGRAVAGEAARLQDFAIRRSGVFSALVAEPGAVADGVILELSAVERARLEYFMAVLGQDAVQLTVAGQGVAGHVGTGGEAWDAAQWQAQFASTAMVTAQAVLAGMRRTPAARVAARLGSMAVAASSFVRASKSAPTTLRFAAGKADVEIVAERRPYARFFAIEEYDVSWRRFDGGMSQPVTRAAFISGDAVTVLPYDVARDRVLVIEQFRAGPLARGDAQAWQIEAIAGRIDPGESPEEAARREAVEEADLRLEGLIAVAQFYPSPGAVSEYIYSYVALVDLPDGSAGVFGVEGEAEDIRGHLISLDRLMELVASGEIENAPLILTALWLQRERGRLRPAS